MANIVTRLREQSEYNDPANGLGGLCGEAAAEIERLERIVEYQDKYIAEMERVRNRYSAALWDIIDMAHRREVIAIAKEALGA